MKYNIPLLSEVNFQSKEFNFYFEEAFEKDKLTFQVEVDPVIISEKEIGFFIHIEFFYPKYSDAQESSEHELFSLLHVDYTCEITFPEQVFSEKKVIIPTSDLTQLLGMSFLMTRGAIAIRLKGNTLEGITFPIQNPTKMLEDILEKTADGFVLEQ